MRQDAFHRDDPTGVLLPRAINHSHTAAADLFQNFVMTETPQLVGHVRFREDAFKRFTGRLAFGFKSFAQETVNAGSVIELGYGTTLWTFRRISDSV
jgi:hypothetical protein